MTKPGVQKKKMKTLEYIPDEEEKQELMKQISNSPQECKCHTHCKKCIFTKCWCTTSPSQKEAEDWEKDFDYQWEEKGFWHEGELKLFIKSLLKQKESQLVEKVEKYVVDSAYALEGDIHVNADKLIDLIQQIKEEK